MCILAVSSAPVITSVTAIDSFSVHVMWTSPSQPNGVITDYTITYNIGGIVNTVNVPSNGVTVSTIKYLVIMLHLHIYGMLF